MQPAGTNPQFPRSFHGGPYASSAPAHGVHALRENDNRRGDEDDRRRGIDVGRNMAVSSVDMEVVDDVLSKEHSTCLQVSVSFLSRAKKINLFYHDFH